MRTALQLIIVATVSLLLSCKGGGERLYKETRTALYTVTSVTVVSSSPEKAQDAIEAAFAEMERLGSLLNFYSDESELSLINRKAGVEAVKASDDTMEIMGKAVFASEQTDGAFDPTVGPVVKLWDFQEKRIPDEKSIREKVKEIGYRHIVLDKEKGTVYLDRKGMQIDLGGIVKGFAADKAVAVLRREGISSGIVSVGGEVRAFGKRPDGEMWNVGVKNPRQQGSDDELIAAVRLLDRAASTSGDYEKFFEKDGTRYHHILDPKTGYPVSLCRSVTVIAPEAAMTDAFATGVFVLGPQKGLALLKKLDFEGIIVGSDGAILVTDGLKDKVTWFGKKS
ncbi:MAG TPA: FAD:protein FMN transferase [Dissulfurispiraceae bacterium]|nr:FAD:protein FMN transferase [Dissulfurispiraceae bacterium]